MTESAIAFHEVTKVFGRTRALDRVSYEVSRGSVCALLGQNGAGKTTSIRCLLDLLRPTSGNVEVAGMDSVDDSVAIHQRVGYVPEESSYYPWMTVDQILRFNSGFFARWDDQLCSRLVSDLELPRSRRLRDLSRGMQAKVGLVMALTQRPDLLVLDDPTSGLDPVVRRDFFEALIANAQEDGGTVFFSTHLLHELERVADEVVIMHEGRVLLRESVELLKQRYRRLRLVFSGQVPDLPRSARLEVVKVEAHHLVVVAPVFDGDLLPALRDGGFDRVEATDMDLEEIFVHEIARVTGALQRGTDHDTRNEEAA